ncbi:MAG: AAA family ATPase [Candidatus Dependentiae bacterium]|nr:AAA family ATPase [Candidatus Dependentiae bacterium]
MNNQPKQLGLNCSIFEDFVTENRIYVDKTQHIYNLITARNQKHFYFIFRPRRFGKSLFISTLKAIFAGKKELFNEYWIGKSSSYDWPQHPVIHLDFGHIAHRIPEQFEQNLCAELQNIAQQYSVEKLKPMSPGMMLQDLVRKVAVKGKIVLLVDEYDKPMMDNMDDLSIAAENLKILNSFYAVVKSLEQYWRAIFITGVSKFANNSLFSGLNNLQELSMHPIAAELFGYTHEELVAYFPTYIDDLAKPLGLSRQEALDTMKEWYGGYRFCDDMRKPQMYSPLSVIACLKAKEFANYWCNGGNQEFLIALLRAKGMSLATNEHIEIRLYGFNALDIEDIPLLTLLMQTGYLTIVNYDPEMNTVTLDYPNKEIRESFKNYLMQAFTYASPTVIDKELVKMRGALTHKNFEQFCNAVKTLFAGIPHNLHIAKEAYYHSFFHFMFDLLGMKPKSEEATSRGESDLVLETADSVMVFEFKFSKTAQDALDQIMHKKYHEKYMHKNKAIILVGINVNFKEKQLEFEWLQHSI